MCMYECTVLRHFARRKVRKSLLLMEYRHSSIPALRSNDEAATVHFPRPLSRIFNPPRARHFSNTAILLVPWRHTTRQRTVRTAQVSFMIFQYAKRTERDRSIFRPEGTASALYLLHLCLSNRPLCCPPIYYILLGARPVSSIPPSRQIYRPVQRFAARIRAKIPESTGIAARQAGKVIPLTGFY